MFDGRVVFAVAQIVAEFPQALPEMNDRLGVNLRYPRLGNAERTLNLLEGLTFEIVQLDDGPLLPGKILNRSHEFGANLARLNLAHHIVRVVA